MLNQLNKLFLLNRKIKLSLAVVWDTLVISGSLLTAYWIRIGIEDWHFSAADWMIVGANILFTASVLMMMGHYQNIVRFINMRALYVIAGALFLSIVYLFAARLTMNMFVPMSTLFIYFVLSYVGIAAPRLLIQASAQSKQYQLREKCFVYGAGETGRQLVSLLQAGNQMHPVAFVDDKRKYIGKQILGIPVISRNDIPKVLEEHKVTKMLLAVHNTSDARRKELIEELTPFAISLLTIPSFEDIISGKRQLTELRQIKIEELLGREPVPPIKSLMDVDIRDKMVLVTGAGGSIGSELCRQLIKSRPAKLVLFELSEFNLYQIDNELSRKYPDIEIVPVLANIQDTDIMRQVIGNHKIQTIYHAAAYKHVPLVESNVFAGLRNNIFGTANVAFIATEFEVEKFVLVSTDKAVRPTNIMGATKRFAELFVQGLSELNSSTKFAIVRFGNVLGSSGSVVPLFTKQILSGGPITVTHPEITRYFMTIPEAAQLVIQAGAMGTKGEVFVLDMGEPVKIVDLATKMAHLMGMSVSDKEATDRDTIAINFSGLRPGEKLYEELLIDDADTQTLHPRIMGANEIKIPFDEVVMLLDTLNQALLEGRGQDVEKMLRDEIPLAYSPAEHSGSVQQSLKAVS